MLEKLMENPNLSQDELNALFAQIIIDLTDRLIALEPPETSFHECFICGSEFVIGTMVNDEGYSAWFCKYHSPIESDEY